MKLHRHTKKSSRHPAKLLERGVHAASPQDASGAWISIPTGFLLRVVKRHKCRAPHACSPSAAFTLTEVLVVIAILALLAATQLSALPRSRVPVKGVQCQNNLRQLTLAWVLYANDDQNRMVNNYGSSAIQADLNNQRYQSWANNIMNWTVTPFNGALGSLNTNETLLKNGLLTKYLGDNLGVYQCPADIYLSAVQKSAGWTRRVRSVSMNGVLGSPKPGYSAPYGEFFGSTVRQWYKTTEITRPSWFWVLMDEHPDSINDGAVLNDIGPYLANGTIPTFWSDFPGTHHDGAGPISFVDGHTEYRQWRTTTISPVKYFDWNPNVDARGQRDIAWFYEHSGVLYVP